MGPGIALVVGEAADKGGGFRDNAGQVQGLVDAAPLGGGLVHDAVDEQGLGEAAGVGCGFDHDDNQVQVFTKVHMTALYMKLLAIMVLSEPPLVAALNTKATGYRFFTKVPKCSVAGRRTHKWRAGTGRRTGWRRPWSV